MYSIKFLELLSKLSNKEFIDFKYYVLQHYIGKKTKLYLFLEEISYLHPDGLLQIDNLEKLNTLNTLYSLNDSGSSALRVFLSESFSVLKAFYTKLYLEHNQEHSDLIFLSSITEKNVSKELAEEELRIAKQNLENQKQKDSYLYYKANIDNFYRIFQLYQETKNHTHRNLHIQFIESLISSNILQLLMGINQFKLLNTNIKSEIKFDITYLETSILKFIEHSLPEMHLQIKLYYYFILWLDNIIDKKQKILFEQVDMFFKKSILFTNSNLLQRDYYLNRENEIAIFNNYQELIKNNIILSNRNDTESITFLNIVYYALEKNELDWTKQFIAEKISFINQHQQEDVHNLSLGTYYFYLKNYDNAIFFLNKKIQKDVPFQLRQRAFIFKVYYETNDKINAKQEILSLQNFMIRYKETLSKELNERFTNFIEIAKLIMKNKKIEMTDLKNKIQDMNLIYRSWIVKQLK